MPAAAMSSAGVPEPGHVADSQFDHPESVNLGIGKGVQ